MRGSGGMLTVCIAYGGREELVAAARRTAVDYASGMLSLENINEQAISDRLFTAGLPDADLVIRTSGEERISNFLLWHVAYAELFFSPLPWPAFDAGLPLFLYQHNTSPVHLLSSSPPHLPLSSPSAACACACLRVPCDLTTCQLSAACSAARVRIRLVHLT